MATCPPLRKCSASSLINNPSYPSSTCTRGDGALIRAAAAGAATATAAGATKRGPSGPVGAIGYASRASRRAWSCAAASEGVGEAARDAIAGDARGTHGVAWARRLEDDVVVARDLGMAAASDGVGDATRDTIGAFRGPGGAVARSAL
jgi:hypothetical protein